MCRFLSILYKTYDQIFFKYNLNSIKKKNYALLFFLSYLPRYHGTVLAVRYRYR